MSEIAYTPSGLRIYKLPTGQAFETELKRLSYMLTDDHPICRGMALRNHGLLQRYQTHYEQFKISIALHVCMCRRRGSFPKLRMH